MFLHIANSFIKPKFYFILTFSILKVNFNIEKGDSVRILNSIEMDAGLSVPVRILRQPNGGVSAARNAGIGRAQASMVLVLDGDDRLEPSYLEEVSQLLRSNPAMAAASSWMQTFGVLEAVICPHGGGIESFLSHNGCPATHILRRKAW